MIAAIRIRGETGIRKDIKDTLTLLRLYNKNMCVLLNDNPVTRGMLNKVKDFITFGEIDNDTIQKLVEQKGEPFKGRTESTNKSITYKKFKIYDGKQLKPFFRLENPRGGFERKGIKVPYSKGGVLGYRGEKMAQLVIGMMENEKA